MQMLGHDHHCVDLERMASFDLSHSGAQYIDLIDQQ